MDPRLRQEVFDRAKGRCIRCGKRCDVDGVVHHLKPKGMGGSKDPRAHAITNLALAHDACHKEIHSRVKESYEHGWLLHNYPEEES